LTVLLKAYTIQFVQRKEGVLNLFDYHIHSQYSIDGKMTMDEACRQAIKLGLDEIVFTDHIDLDWPDNKAHFDMNNLELYIKSIETMQERYGDRLIIKKGMELGLQPHALDELNLIVDTFPVDFLIASVHVVDGMDPYLKEYYLDKTKEESYIKYYEQILMLIQKFDNFDVLGHLDYVKRYSPLEWEKDDYLYGIDIIDEIFKVLIEKGKGIEVNTSGYRHISDSPMPNIKIVKRFVDMGGKVITIGSDAHSLDCLAYCFDRALKELKSAGIAELTRFSNRKPQNIAI